MASDKTVRVEVVYAQPAVQHLVSVELAAGANVRLAIERSGLLQNFKEIDLTHTRFGIFGRLVTLDTPVQDGERVEIYRALLKDPKATRRELASKGRTMGKPPRTRHG